MFLQKVFLALIVLATTLLHPIRGDWSQIDLGLSSVGVQYVNIVGVSCSTESKCAAIATEPNFASFVVVSDDAGATWTKVKSFDNSATATAITHASSSQFLLVSNTGSNTGTFSKLYVSDNAGSTWTVATEQFTSVALYDITVGSNGITYLCGKTGSSPKLYKNTASNNYTHWIEQALPTSFLSSTLRGVSTDNGVDVMTVGDDGAVFYSNDSGDTWTASGDAATLCSGSNLYR